MSNVSFYTANLDLQLMTNYLTEQLIIGKTFFCSFVENLTMKSKTM